MEQGFGIDTRIPSSVCCDCGHKSTACAGPTQLAPGDFAICIECGALNVLGEDLRLREPTIDEVLDAAMSPEVYEARQRVSSMPSNPKGLS